MARVQPHANESDLVEKIYSYRNDPQGFVHFNFPWGKEGTPLEFAKGPRLWQTKILKGIADAIRNNEKLSREELGMLVTKMAVCSGRGIGKSALLSWLALWMMSCHPGSTTIVAANTEDQLVNKTFAEIGKWLTLSENSHWFDRTSKKIMPEKWYAEGLKAQSSMDDRYYYIEGQLWNEDNPGAFAGAHNTTAGMMVMFDEASGIVDPIWTVTQGFFSDVMLHRYWFAFSNGRENIGAFYDCFEGPSAPYWDTEHIDSRDVEGIDKVLFQEIIDTKGEDSYEARVEVKGMFPLAGSKQFIPKYLVDEAMERDPVEDRNDPLIIGVDVARFGADESVIYPRIGYDARSYPAKRFKGLDNYQLAEQVIEMINEFGALGKQCSGIFVDGGGNGGGVIDILNRLGFAPIEVQFGSSPAAFKTYRYKSDEMWGRMKDALPRMSLPKMNEPNGRDLREQMTTRLYDYTPNTHLIWLETKKTMKVSPDLVDALALTFAQEVSSLPWQNGLMAKSATAISDYDPFSSEAMRNGSY